MKIGGWKTRSVFERYAIVAHSDVENALDKLEEQRAQLRAEARKKLERTSGQRLGLFIVASRRA